MGDGVSKVLQKEKRKFYLYIFITHCSAFNFADHWPGKVSA